MNLGKGFLIPQENGVIHNGDPWIPVTPEKPATRKNGSIQNGDPLIPVTPENPVMRNDGVIYNGDPWIPVTPENPVTRTSNPVGGEMQRSLTKSSNWHEQIDLMGRISAETPVIQKTFPALGEAQGDQMGRTNWKELLGLYQGVLQEAPTNEALHVSNPDALSVHCEHNKRDGAAAWADGCFNLNSDSCIQNFMKDVNGTPSRSIHATDKLPLTSSHPTAGNEQANYQFANSMVLQQQQALSSNQEIITSNQQKMPSDGISFKYKPVNNLNSPPRAESTIVSCAANCLQFEPAVTPGQGTQVKNRQIFDIQNFSTDESLRHEKDNQELISTNSQVENPFEELLDNVIVAPTASNATSPKGNTVSEDRDCKGIDLNKTPQQRTPKRKKHRPKVVVEGKPKRNPKPPASKDKILNKNPSGKRKYVRKKGLEASISRPGNESFGVETSCPSPAAKSCRRALNFDLESRIYNTSEDKMVDDQIKTNLKSKPFDLNFKSPETVQDAICPTSSGIVSDISITMEGEQSGRSAEIQQGESISNVICDNNQKLAEKSSPPVPTASTTAVRDHNLDVIARSQNLQTAISCQNNNQSWSSQGYQLLNGEGMGQMPLQANTNLTKLDVAQQTMLRSSTTFLKEIAEGKEKRGSKRDHWHTSQMVNPESVDLMHSQLSHHDISRTAKQKNISGETRIATLEANKRSKFEYTCQGVVSSEASYVASVQYSSREVESKSRSSIHESRSSSCTYGRLPNFNLGMQSNFGKQTSAGNEILADQGTSTTTVGNGFEDQRASSTHVRLLMARKDLHHNAAADSFNVTAGTTDCLVVSPSQQVPATTLVNETTTSPVDLSVKRQTLVPASPSQAFSKEKLHPKKNKKKLGCQDSSVKAKEPKNRQNCAVTIDEIVYRLERLKISKSRKKLIAKDQNAIVPYKADDKVVIYEGFDPIKRRKLRPKVDLDQETNRLWNLLMGKAGSENMGTTENEKEKWWEGERKVVRGRIDSFIARMHLVQGDRRFSQWKGSVVDSVIGVFLTQNVSDHLSSSAFMSLASKFPVQLTNSEATSCKYGPMLWIEEPDVQIIDPDGTITYHGINIRQPLYKQSSMTLSESSERRSDHLNSETGVHYANENSSGTEEEVVSSQNSSDSFPQSAKYTRSSSDSEVEDHIMVCNSLKTCISESTPKTKRSVTIQQYQCQVLSGMLLDKNPMSSFQQQENSACIRITPRLSSGSNQRAYPLNSDVLCLQGTLSPSGGSCLDKASDIESSEHGSLSSFFSTFTETTEIGSVAHSRKEMGGIARSASCSTARQTGIPINHATRIDDQCSDQHRKVELQSGFLSSQESANSNQVQISQSFLQEEKSGIEPKRLDAVDAKGQTGHIFFPSEQLSKADTNIPNTRKRKPKVDKTKAVDWDSLRKKVLSKVGKREKCANNMDSLDYDALRCADMKTVSDAIHDRGMNNMLAERIQDFLNRLVREHGSTDLEWLRDVEEAEAKEYLLSFRGLGLKSVECVRLLTLHQVAFPVDTNVGRIAVRLGWVPLQPLPESLQLHLLELYPVLESIQKYLWPRLCKLDQKTLYELHYQLITFGKVFCTKRKPNCNACPMRAECRHFASAFASARLALPGPEERSMVNLTTPMAANEIPPIPVNPIPLPPAEADVGCEAHCSGSKCEPIIEEPATPEPSPEAPESDIEDLFYEDPDEIPMINFSMEELKMNVQSVLQEQNMEFQPEDLSRALVALDPSTASIPVPKLKNVSRLRTEHRVYELPDSHALLKGMESREPDDPSPYLLAIWGPGETADSSQPPEGCSSSLYVIEENSQTVKGTLLIPCRTAMRGSFPLNGTYFQVNEMFADHESSKNPIDVPRDWLWQLPRRTVYFGTSVTSIFRGLPAEGIQYCFWRGFVCVRGFDREQRAPRPLHRRLHEPASKMVKNKNNDKQKKDNAKETNRVN